MLGNQFKEQLEIDGGFFKLSLQNSVTKKQMVDKRQLKLMTIYNWSSYVVSFFNDLIFSKSFCFVTSVHQDFVTSVNQGKNFEKSSEIRWQNQEFKMTENTTFISDADIAVNVVIIRKNNRHDASDIQNCREKHKNLKFCLRFICYYF